MMKRMKNEQKENENGPLNVKKGDIVKAFLDSALHFLNCLGSGKDAVLSLCCTPVLLNEIELAMVLGIKVAQVTMLLDKLLEL